jgi:hypothetical protein
MLGIRKPVARRNKQVSDEEVKTIFNGKIMSVTPLHFKPSIQRENVDLLRDKKYDRIEKLMPRLEFQRNIVLHNIRKGYEEEYDSIKRAMDSRIQGLPPMSYLQKRKDDIKKMAKESIHKTKHELYD